MFIKDLSPHKKCVAALKENSPLTVSAFGHFLQQLSLMYCLALLAGMRQSQPLTGAESSQTPTEQKVSEAAEK